MPAPDLHIIGQGLAGAILAETAVQQGLRVRVWDDGGPACSQIAAGLFTPLTGDKLVPSWSLDEALPEVFSFYPAIEKQHDTSFFHPLSICRLFTSAKQREGWDQKTTHAAAREQDVSALPFEAPWGGITLDGGGWVDLSALLKLLHERRRSRGEWAEPDHRAGTTVWAEGARAQQNPLWNDVGWRNAHGDVLTVKIPDLDQSQIYNFGTFLVPLGDQAFRCGATYAWDQDSPAPRDQGRQELELKLKAVLRLPYEVLAHAAGLRPVAHARVPIAGPHPEHKQDWIFNGFGSKGVLYAPWMARRMIRCLMDAEPLPPETWAPRRIQRQRDRMATEQLRAARPLTS